MPAQTPQICYIRRSYNFVGGVGNLDSRANDGEKPMVDGMSAVTQTHEKLVTLVEDIIDTVATFDGRIAYTRKPGGNWDVTFRARDGELALRISARTTSTCDVQVAMEHRGTPEIHHQEIYVGPFDAKVVRYQVSTALAQWYQQAVLHQAP